MRADSGVIREMGLKYVSMLPSRLQRPRVVWDCIYSYRSLGEGKRPTHSIQSDEVNTYANRICITARVNEYIHRYIITLQFT